MFFKLNNYATSSMISVKFLESRYYKKEFFFEFIFHITVTSFCYIASDYAINLKI